MFYSFFFNSPAKSWYLSFFSLSFSFILWSAGTAKSIILQILFFLLIIIIIIIIIIYSLEFFTSALADGLSLEFEWQQVSPSLQDSSQYSSRLQ